MSLTKFAAVLASQTDGHRRHVTLSATDADAAAVLLMQRELEAVSYFIDTDQYLDDAAKAALGDYVIQDDGKVRGPDKRLRGKLHQHHQTEPYEVVSLEPVRLDDGRVQRLVRELTQLQQDPHQWKSVLAELRDAGLPLAAVTAYMYGVPVKNQYDGTAISDWDTDTQKTSLHTVTYTGNQDTDDFFNDATNEVTGTGYTAGGVTLASKTVTYDTATDQTRLDAADAAWPTSTITARSAVTYKSTGTASTSPLLTRLDFGVDVSSSGGTFQVTWDSLGIVVIDVT